MASDLDISYRVGTPEQELKTGDKYDVVIALEVIEHVRDVGVFVEGLAGQMTPGGLLILSTINRTAKSLVLAKFVAEYVLNWVPRGTHEWTKFVRPSELTHALRSKGLSVNAIRGMSFDLATGEWQPSYDVKVNYILSATKT